jgi:hypothetical protein
MNMSDQIKRAIVLFALTAWVLLFGFSFAEDLESLQDTLESPDQNVEQALSLPMDQVIYIWDEFPEMPKSVGLMTVAVVNDLQTSNSLLYSVSLQHHGSPYRPQLFKLLSTYRL